jgi:hypothetical protein
MAAGAAAGKVVGAAGAIMQGQAQAAALNAHADQQIQNAQEAENQGQFDAVRSDMNSGLKIGRITANYGASGVSASSGSVLDVLGASHMNAELDRQNILHGADVRAINFQNQASMDRVGATNAIQGSYWSALGQLGAGGADAYSKAYGGATPTGGSGSSGEGSIEDYGDAVDSGGVP